jgi:hypothetical protein
MKAAFVRAVSTGLVIALLAWPIPGRSESAGPLAHVVLHVGLCRAIERVAAATTIPLHVSLADRVGHVKVDRVFRVERGDEAEAIVEFDSAFGIYELQIAAPKYRCGASDYLFFIDGHDRSVNENLADSSQPPSPRPILLSGTAPQSFLYVAPTFVLFDKKAVACNKPIAAPLPETITVENDQDAYYASLSAGPAGSAPEQLALRLRTATHRYHYVRIPFTYPAPWSGWPESITFNVSEEMVDSLAGEPVDTLLCPKLWATSAG